MCRIVSARYSPPFSGPVRTVRRDNLLHCLRMARQRLGQHFLADPGWREQIAQAIRVSPQSVGGALPHSANIYCWIEIGAGHGEITEQLAASGAPVIAIEIDPSLAGQVRKLARSFPNLTVIEGDILQMDIADLAAGRRARIYGNLPYYITSPILQHLFQYSEIIDEIDIVIQTEVALRLTAEPRSKSYGYLSVLTQLFARPEFVFEIPRAAFRPPPEVGSALVALRLPSPLRDLRQRGGEPFLQFVKVCFSQKRKTLANNLRVGWTRPQVQNALITQNLKPEARAEELSVADLAALHQALATAATNQRT
jgi:16S rRNA (adenine1518-N6/adenine1519-N6)-dimethyltransferase